VIVDDLSPLHFESGSPTDSSVVLIPPRAVEPSI
jgi:hypothetical protein